MLSSVSAQSTVSQCQPWMNANPDSAWYGVQTGLVEPLQLGFAFSSTAKVCAYLAQATARIQALQAFFFRRQ
jgi:hypothetical protein